MAHLAFFVLNHLLMKPLVRSRLALLLLIAALISCDRGMEQSALVRGNGGDPGSLDPALAEDVHAFNVLADLYEGLLRTAADGSLESGAARSWSVSEDGRHYTFDLHEEARWSNGDPVTAADFVYAMKRVASADTPSSYAFLLRPILNFGEIKSGLLPETELGVRAIDDRTLAITLTEPASHFLSVLAMPIAYPVHRSISG